MSFLSYRWCAVLACISVAISETEMQSPGLTGPTLSRTQMGCLTAMYYGHSMLMWYRADSLKSDSEKGVPNWLTWPRQLYWLLETAVVVALTCLCLGLAGDQAAHSLTQ